MMDERSVFDIDCHRVIPECGFECAKCIGEIVSMLTGAPGVRRYIR